MGTIANAKVTHYYNCYNGDFIGCLPFSESHYYIQASQYSTWAELPFV